MGRREPLVRVARADHFSAVLGIWAQGKTMLLNISCVDGTLLLVHVIGWLGLEAPRVLSRRLTEWHVVLVLWRE